MRQGARTGDVVIVLLSILVATAALAVMTVAIKEERRRDETHEKLRQVIERLDAAERDRLRLEAIEGKRRVR